MSYEGDFTQNQTFTFHFTSRSGTPVPITLAGSPVLAVLNSSGSSITPGVTLEVDTSSTTGLHKVTIDLSADVLYVIKGDYSVIITTGTVDGNSVVGEVIATFSIENRHVKAISRGGRYG